MPKILRFKVDGTVDRVTLPTRWSDVRASSLDPTFSDEGGLYMACCEYPDGVLYLAMSNVNDDPVNFPQDLPVNRAMTQIFPTSPIRGNVFVFLLEDDDETIVEISLKEAKSILSKISMIVPSSDTKYAPLFLLEYNTD